MIRFPGGDSRGYSLVEIVAAMGVFSVALTGFFAMAQQKARSLTWAREQEAALRGAENRMAELRALPRDALAAENGRDFAVPGLRLEGKEAGRVAVEAGPEPGVLRLAVAVAWSSYKGVRREIALETLVLAP